MGLLTEGKPRFLDLRTRFLIYLRGYLVNSESISESLVHHTYLLFISVFQTFIMQSYDPEIALSPSLVTATADTSFVCPNKV